jgi:hypothetical protein
MMRLFVASRLKLMPALYLPPPQYNLLKLKENLNYKPLLNIQSLVCPFLLKEKSESLGNIPRQEDFLILESYLKEIILPLIPKLSDTGIRLFSSEIKVAVRIRLGKSTRQIANFLNSSGETFNSYRKNIRKKWEEHLRVPALNPSFRIVK